MGEKLALLDTSILIDFFRKTDKKNSRFYYYFAGLRNGSNGYYAE